MKQSPPVRRPIMKQQVTGPAAKRNTTPTAAPERTILAPERASQFALPPSQSAAFATLPLRLFLGITFAYAGVQKLTDPGFFRPGATTYIGSQINAFAHISPLGGFLSTVVAPHAAFFGAMIAWGELAIGLGTLVGALYRAAAFFGALVSLILWLSATWTIKPYFYGADIFALFAWITLLFAGTGGYLALDPWLETHIWVRVRAWPTVAGVLGGLRDAGLLPANGAASNSSRYTRYSATRYTRYSATKHAAQNRRQFLSRLGIGAAAVLGGLAFWNVTHQASADSPAAGSDGAGSSTAGGGATVGDGAATATTTSGGNVLATLSNLQPNSAVNFRIPSNNDTGVLVRLRSGSVVAFDATCTHAGCPVQFDTGSGHLLCPCHGAEFDPSKNAAVVQGPTDQPLAPVAIAVNQATGNITLS